MQKELEPKELLKVISSTEIFSSIDAARLVVVPRNAARLDYRDRHLFKVVKGKKVICLVLIGKDLEDLWSRHEKFAEACPQISVKPLAFKKEGDLGFLITEHLEGESLEEAVLNGSISIKKGKQIVRDVMDELEQTTIPSTQNAMIKELDCLVDSICSCPLFNAADVAFLGERIFPYLYDHLLSAKPSKRWTNGDFIGRNIIVSKSGLPKLIDYEFARSTHWGEEDFWRWQNYSSFPDAPEMKAIFTKRDLIGESIEALFLLNQIDFEYRIVGVSAALEGLAPKISRLKELSINFDGGLRHSLFYGADIKSFNRANQESSVSQLFWSDTSRFSEQQSIRKEVKLDELTNVRTEFLWEGSPLHLRFDVCECVGVIEIINLKVSANEGQLLYEANDSTQWDRFCFEKDATPLISENRFLVLSSASDPVILLPSIVTDSIVEDARIIFECEILIHSDLRKLLPLISEYEIREKRVRIVELSGEIDAFKISSENLQISCNKLEGELEASKGELIDTVKSNSKMLKEKDVQIAHLEERVQSESKIWRFAIERLENLFQSELDRLDSDSHEIKIMRDQLKERLDYVVSRGGRKARKALLEPIQKSPHESRIKRFKRIFGGTRN
jgi:hypothetical protein